MTMSQDEINAMLNGLDTPGDDPQEPSAQEEGVRTEAQTEASEERQEDGGSHAHPDEAAAQAEADLPIDPAELQAALEAELAAAMAAEAPPPPQKKKIAFNPEEWKLSPEEIDVLGEVGNMCMGAVATTMYTLLDRRASITTPVVSVHTTQEVLAMYTTPFVVVEVEYVEGIDGKNLLLLKEYDAALITDLLMGGDGTVAEPIKLTELHMSAISEIMNQMIGASATAMAKILSMPVNISPPTAFWVEEKADVSEFLDESQIVVKISFDMEIEGLLNSQLLQMIPFSLTKDMVKTVKAVGGLLPHHEAKSNLSSQTETILAHGTQNANQSGVVDVSQPYDPSGTQNPNAQSIPQIPMYATDPYQQPAYPPQGYPAYPAAQADYGYPRQPAPQPGNLVDVRPMQFQSFDQGSAAPAAIGGMGLIGDIPLQVSVELGKTRKDINEILDFGVGTVMVLDKVAGDPVEILVNGKLVARGEVVVIDDNYGVRITEIVHG